MIAAGGENGKDVCHGDSGGPLFVKDKSGNYTQIGIAAAAKCTGGTAGVWTEVNYPTIYNFITKAAGLGSANQGAGNKKGSNKKGSNKKGSGSNKDKPSSGSNKEDNSSPTPTPDPGSSTGGAKHAVALLVPIAAQAPTLLVPAAAQAPILLAVARVVALLAVALLIPAVARVVAPQAV